MNKKSLDKDACIKALAKALQRYVAEDDTREGGKWEEINAPWLKVKRDAETLLESLDPKYLSDDQETP